MLKTKKKLIVRLTLLGCLITAGVIWSCKDSNKESIIKGSVEIGVDKTLFPITEDLQAVFQSQYQGKIKLDSVSESQAVNNLLSGKSEIVILSRRLRPSESASFDKKGLEPRVTAFAKDAIVFILNKNAKDTVIDVEQVLKLMRGEPSTIKKLVFDDPNSSTVLYMDSLAGVKRGLEKGVFSVKSHLDVLKYVSQNPEAVGVVGLNPIVQPYPEWMEFQDEIKVASVKYVKNATGGTAAYKPNQSNIAEGLYPLTRTLYMLNYQGIAGLGMGFASYIAGEDGQRIVLKSGLMPIRIPSRTLNIRKKINTNK